MNERQKAADCMAQHIKTFRNQCMNNEFADFGVPCAECQYNHQCDFEWLTVMQPILKNSSVKISMVLKEQN